MEGCVGKVDIGTEGAIARGPIDRLRKGAVALALAMDAILSDIEVLARSVGPAGSRAMNLLAHDGRG
jgi:hypothetical protein